MSTLFISHSSKNNEQAVKVRDWLAAQGWTEIFLDFDPNAGIVPGRRWREELKKAGARCSAILVLISEEWLASKECWDEFRLATELGKDIFPCLITPCLPEDLPEEMRAYQFADISSADRETNGFERLRIGLHRAGLAPDSFRWPPVDEPNRPFYPGLRALEEQDAAIFFGRDLHITKALDCIRRMRHGAPERMLVILGASGAGKSSFLKAGLLARLRRDTLRFHTLPCLRPSRSPLTGPTGLQSVLGMDHPLDTASILTQLRKLRETALEERHRYLADYEDESSVIPPTIILPIDQAEELFATNADTDTEAATAIALLAEIVARDPNLLIIATIRSDSYNLLQNDQQLEAIPKLPFDLPKMSPASLKEIIEGPCKLPTVTLTIDADLTEQLIHDFPGADSLPLLACTLERLYVDYGDDGRLEKQEYLEQMQGMGGAILRTVDHAFTQALTHRDLPNSLEELKQMAQRCFIPGLVRIEKATSTPKRRVSLRRDLPADTQPLIDCFIKQRLLVAEEDKNFGPTVEVAHEAILNHWPDLADWIDERRNELFLAEGVMAAAHDWQEAPAASRNESLIHRGERLQAAEELLLWEELKKLLGESSIAYLSACRDEENRIEAVATVQVRRQRWFRRWITGLVATGALMTVVGSLLIIKGQRNLGVFKSLALHHTSNNFTKTGNNLHGLRLALLATKNTWLLPTIPEAWSALASSAQSLKLLCEFRGHERAIDGALMSSDESRIMTWSGDNTVRLWNAKTGVQIEPILKHDDLVKGARFSRNGNRILSWSADKTVRIWDVATGIPIGPRFKHDGEVNGAIFSSDESRILTWSSDKTVRLWNAKSGEQIEPFTIKHDDAVQGASFSKNEDCILTWSDDQTVRLWNATTGKQIVPALKHDNLDSGAVLGASLSKDETRILTWSWDKTVRLWNATNGEQIGQALKHDDWVKGASFSNDENRLLTWSFDQTARLWDAINGEQIGPALKHDGWVKGAIFSKDESRILTWSSDKTARLWNATNGEQICPALKHDGCVNGASFSKDESRILTWSSDQTVRLWDTKTCAQIGPALKHDGEVNGIVWSKDEKSILSWSNDQTAHLWDISTDSITRPVLRPNKAMNNPRKKNSHGTVFSKNGSQILTWGGDNSARLWDAATGKEIVQALKHGGDINGAVISKDESRILTWSSDNTAHLWDAATGKEAVPALKHEKGVNGASFSNDNSHILTWSADNTAHLWDASTGSHIDPSWKNNGKIKGALVSKDNNHILIWEGSAARLMDRATGALSAISLKHNDTVKGAIFSADESRILTWSADHTARLWDTATGTQIGASMKHNDVVKGALFSSDESRILTWSDDLTARIWDTATATQIGPEFEHSNGIINAQFSNNERQLISWGNDYSMHTWDIHWAMRNPQDPNFIPDLCREILVGASIKKKTPDGREMLVGVRHIDEIDVKAAPILRGREGEDVCAPPPSTWQTLVTLIRGH